MRPRDDFTQLDSLGTYLDSMTMGLQPETCIEGMTNLLADGVGGMHKSGNLADTRAQDIYWESIETIAKMLNLEAERIVPIPGREVGLNLLAPLFEQVELWTMDDNSVHAPFIGRTSTQVRDELIGGDVTVASTLSALTGERSGIEELEGIKIIDTSYENIQYYTRCRELHDTIIVMDGSVGLLGPLGSGLMYVGEGVGEQLGNYAVGSLGVASVTSSSVSTVNNIDRFLLEPVNIVALHGLARSIEYTTKIPTGLFDYSRYVSNLTEFLGGIEGIKVVSTEESSHLSFTLNGWNAQELAIILSEGYNVQTRGGQLCSHLAVDKLGVTDVTRLSFHCYTEDEDISRFRDALEDLLG